MFRKTLAIRVCALVLVLALAACGGGQAPAVSEAEPPEVEAPATALLEAPAAEPATDLPEPTDTAEPSATPEPEPTAVPEEEGCLTSGEVVEVISTGGGITGQGIMQVVVNNPTGEEIVVGLEPGCYFAPPDDSQQRMMVLQRVEVALPAGGTETLDPYVACIDSGASSPEQAAAYTIGEMVSNPDLQAFAQCLSEQELPADFIADFDGIMGLQFAIWQVGDGYSVDAYMEEWLDIEDDLGGELGDMMDMVIPMMQAMTDSAKVWLDVCGVEPAG